MKDDRGRRLTRKQKLLLANQPRRLNVDNWLCISDDGKTLVIMHKISGRTASIKYA